MKKSQSGFTVIELIMGVTMLVGVAATGAVVYITLHFIAKFW